MQQRWHDEHLEMDLSIFEAPGTLREAIVDHLRAEIMNGGLPPGHPIKDAELARQLKVSITPIREAVMQLTAEGWLEILPNKRRRVAAFTQRDAMEAMDVELVVMRALIERAGPKVSLQHHADLDRGLDMFCRALPEHAAAESRQGFGLIMDTLLGAADHRELEQLVKFAMVRASTRLVTYPSDHLIQNWVSTMTQIVHRIEAGETEGALEVLDAHTRFVLSTMSRDRDAGDAIQQAVPVQQAVPTGPKP